MKQKNVILLVVAVGCGIVAAVLTSQMRAQVQVEQVDVLVAAKDLPVGTTISKDDLKDEKLVKIKKMPKDGLPPSFVMDKEQLVDKRLARPLRAEETFNPQDLIKGGAITLPAGYNMVSLPLGAGQAAAGFVGPGSRVDVIATLRLSKQLHSFPLLVNMLVVAVNTQTTYNQQDGGAFPNLSMVSFAVQGKEAMVLALAKTRGCNLELILRHPETSDTNEKNDKLDEVIKLLSDSDLDSKVINPNGEKRPDGNKDKEPTKEPVKPSDPAKPDATVTKPAPEVAPVPSIAVIRVLVAKRDIEPNTSVTADLIKEAFEWKDLPKDFAANALAENNYEEALGKAFKVGVAKDQWVTWAMVGIQSPKDAPREHFSPAKPGADDTKPVEPKALKKNQRDVTVTTTGGSLVYRYEEVTPGNWKLLELLTPEQAAKKPISDTPNADQDAKPDAKPEAKRD